MNTNLEKLKPPFTHSEIKYLCKVSYENDFDIMLLNYEHALKRAKKQNNQHQIKVFTREIKTINEIKDKENHHPLKEILERN